MLGHPLQDETSPSSLQSVAFATVVDEAARHGDVAIELGFRPPFDTAVALPSNVDDAGEWNRLAARANRVRFSLVPSGNEALAGVSALESR